MSVLITGAAGSLGSMLRHRLAAFGWDLRYFDRTPVPDDGGAPGHTVVGELGDRGSLDDAFASRPRDVVQAVVHLAGQPTEAPWPVVREANIDGAYELFEAARRHGVRRIVLASSNHAAGFTPRGEEQLADDTPARPDTLYGVSKVFGEALARYYVDRYGFGVACLRIGSCHERPDSRRDLSTWLSPADFTGLVDAALRAPSLTFATVWGVSANRHRWWSIEGASALGYTPTDDAATLAPQLADQASGPFDDRVGGPFTGPEYGIDETLAGMSR